MASTDDSTDDTQVGRGIAIFLLVFSIVFLVVSTVATALFYRERKAFEIRARSAYLVMLTGLAYMAVVCKIMVNQSEHVFDHEKNVYVAKTVKYFATVCSTCCYGSRTIRLVLQYSPRARKTAPWLLPEWHHVVACILLGLAAMIAPIYDYVDEDSSDEEAKELKFVERADHQLWIISLTCKIIVIAINPLTWYVDDIFNLGRELRVYIVVLLIQIVGGKVAEGEDISVTRWVDNENLDFLAAVIMFSLSVIYPLKERFLHPMQSSDPEEIEALRKRKGVGMGGTGSVFLWRSTTGGGRPSWTRKDSDSVTTTQADDDDPTMAGIASATASPGSWTYERVISMPEVSVAFEEFSRKALCQESLAFLKDVTTYQTQSFTADEEGGHDGVLGREDLDQLHEEQFGLLSYIVREYIVDGAPNEVNLSSKDKKSIVEVHKQGRVGFGALPERDQRCVFAQAYSEIRFMLESNLMRKFVATDGFKEALAADQSVHNYQR